MHVCWADGYPKQDTVEPSGTGGVALGNYPFLILALAGALAVHISLLRFWWRRQSRLRRCVTNGSLVVWSILGTLMAAEGVCRALLVQSDSLNVTIAGQRWMRRYWGPTNRWGFRDREHDLEALAERKVLFVVGDSFVAGHGIRNRSDRFSDVLQTLLGRQWAVLNMGKNGWSTASEYRAIAAAPVQPDGVVLSYYVNDIMPAAQRLGRTAPTFAQRPRGILAPFVESSHLINFVYWRCYRSRLIGTAPDHVAYCRRIYNDPLVWESHCKELRRIVDCTRARGAALTVVVFPHLQDVQGTRSITAKVAEVLRSQGVGVLDLGPALADRDPAELVVNAVDAHPSVALHREVALRLHEMLRSHEDSAGGT